METEGRKLEAEVGPVKYLAEMVYGSNTDTGTLEKAVRFVIIMIIFVFDPLAVLLLIASQYTFSTLPPKISKPPIVEPPVRKPRTVKPKTVEVVKIEPVVEPIKRQPRKRITKVVEDPVVDTEPAIDYDDAEYQARAARLAATEAHDAWKLAKKTWKEENPDLNLKSFKDDYVRGKISDLPWAAYVNDNENYVQNSEQGSNTLWKQIRDNANGSDNNNNAT